MSVEQQLREGGRGRGREGGRGRGRARGREGEGEGEREGGREGGREGEEKKDKVEGGGWPGVCPVRLTCSAAIVLIGLHLYRLVTKEGMTALCGGVRERGTGRRERRMNTSTVGETEREGGREWERGKKGRREGRREGWREGGRGREGVGEREEGREGGKKGGMEGGREGEGGKEGGRWKGSGVEGETYLANLWQKLTKYFLADERLSLIRGMLVRMRTATVET